MLLFTGACFTDLTVMKTCQFFFHRNIFLGEGHHKRLISFCFHCEVNPRLKLPLKIQNDFEAVVVSIVKFNRVFTSFY